MQETAADSVAIVGELDGGLQTMHTKNGWRSIAWAFYPSRSQEEYGVDISHDALLDIYKALFGEDLKLAEDASEDVKTEYRRKLLRGLRLLLAAVGIGYTIAVTDTEQDIPRRDRGGDPQTTLAWMIEGSSDRWFGRLARQACGFQLTSDPKKAADAKQYAIELAREVAERDYYDSDGF